MNPNTFYLYALSVFALLSTAFGGYYFDDSDDDDDGFRIRMFGGHDGNDTDDEMRNFNKKLDKAVDVVNETFKSKIKPKIESLTNDIKNAKKPEGFKLDDKKWEEIKQQKIDMLVAKLYKDLSSKYFRNYGNFVTDYANENNEDYMTNYGGKSIFDIPDSYYEPRKSVPNADDLVNEVLEDAMNDLGATSTVSGSNEASAKKTETKTTKKQRKQWRKEYEKKIAEKLIAEAKAEATEKNAANK